MAFLPTRGLLDPLGADQRRQALGAGLLNAGAAMMQGGQGGLLGTLGQGLAGFNQGRQGFLDQLQRDQLFDLKVGELEAAKTAREREAEQEAAAAEAMANLELPPQIDGLVRARAQFDPQGAFDAVQKYILDTQGGADPQSALGKLQADLRAGLITQPQFDAAYNEMTHVSGPASTTVNLPAGPIDYGNPPTDTAWARNPDGTVKLDDRGVPIALPIQGSKAFLAQEAAAEAEENQTEQTARAGNVVLQDIARAREKIETSTLPTTGMFGPVLSGVGGTAASDVRSLLDTVKSNIGFDRLQAMREASPTGGALGQVTERELAFLQATLGSLEQSQTQEQLLENLDRLEVIYTGILNKAAAYPNASEFGFAPPATAAPETPANPYAGMTDEQVVEELRKQGYLE